VIGVEVIPEAIENAKQNAILNHIGNCEFIAGKAEELTPSLPPADVIVVDPPRKGLDRIVIETILLARPDRIVYVSCDSATLARDLALLTQGGYNLRKVQPVDQFCHTVHVETVCLLSNRKPDTKVRIDVDLEDYYRIKDAKKNQN
jgi:23S rRNA (uracil1939-C5)-methyltransferase